MARKNLRNLLMWASFRDGGHVFSLYSSCRTKDRAQMRADQLRAKGFHARIKRHGSGQNRGYNVYADVPPGYSERGR